MKKTIAFIALAVVAAVFLIAPIALLGCSPAAKQEAAKDAYMAQQMDCVKQYDTRPEIDACRAAVREAWGLAPDAGKDGSQ